jgi:prepilin-type N-terminal cleavage/methylation domain-containing protein
MQARRGGFTLIELLIVLVLVGILATIGLSRFWTAKDRALVATMKGDLRSLATQQEIYYERNFSYALDLAALEGFNLSPGIDLDITHADNAGWAGVATSPSVSSGMCGFFFGTVPSGAGAPATDSGVVECQ